MVETGGGYNAVRVDGALSGDIPRSVRHLEILSDLSAQLLGGQSEREVLAELFDVLHREMGVAAAFAFAPNPANEALELTVFTGELTEECLAPIRRVAVGQGIVGKVALTRQALHLDFVQSTIDPRYEHVRSRGYSAFASEPVIADNHFLGVLCFGATRQEYFEPADLMFFQAIARHVALARDRAEKERALEECNRELQHRVNNMLSMVQAVAVLSRKGATDIADYQHRFGERLQALARTHNLLTRHDQTVMLRALICSELEPFDTPGRLRLRGPQVKLPADLATYAGMVIHELTTNAIKYGALSVEEGRIHAIWSSRPEGGGRRVLLHWIEENGPEVRQPDHRGFGDYLLGHSLGSHFRVQREFLKHGVRATIAIALDD